MNDPNDRTFRCVAYVPVGGRAGRSSVWPGVLGATSSPVLPCVSAFWFLGGLPSPPGPRSLSVSGSLGQAGPQPCPHQCAKAPDGSGQLCSGRCPGRPGVCPGDRLACPAQGRQQLLGHVLHGHRGPRGICDAGRQLAAQLTPRPLGMPAHAWRSVARGSAWFCHSRCSAELTAGSWGGVRGPPSSSSHV